MAKAIFFSALLLFSHMAFSYTENEDYVTYDGIIQELSTKQSALFTPYSESKIHIGAGYLNSTSKIRSPRVPIGSMTLEGIQGQMGMDLGSNFLTAVHVSYLAPSTKRSVEMKAFGFDISGAFQPRLGRIFEAKFGAGVGFKNVVLKTEDESFKFTNPLVSVFTGIESKISPDLGFSTEVALKNSLTNSHAEKYMIDLIVRIDGHF